MKILLIEDEKELAKGVLDHLRANGILCEYAANAAEAEEKVNMHEYDCIVLDLMLPDGNGLEILQRLKKEHKEAGIIITSSKDGLETKLTALGLGADDYLTKPFHLSELLARIQAIVRRKNFEGHNEIIFEEITVDLTSKITRVDNQEVVLTKKEQELLLYFIANKNNVVSKAALAEYLSGDMADLFDNYDFIYAHIKNLKRKLREAKCKDYIHGIYGLGYRFTKRED